MALGASGRRGVVLSGAVNALVVGAGFVSFGPVGGAVGGLLAGSLLAALDKYKLDPKANLSGSELALLTLAKK
jgi:hypothetical protein